MCDHKMAETGRTLDFTWSLISSLVPVSLEQWSEDSTIQSTVCGSRSRCYANTAASSISLICICSQIYLVAKSLGKSPDSTCHPAARDCGAEIHHIHLILPSLAGSLSTLPSPFGLQIQSETAPGIAQWAWHLLQVLNASEYRCLWTLFLYPGTLFPRPLFL